MVNNTLLFFGIIFVLFNSLASQTIHHDVHHLKPGQVIHTKRRFDTELSIYCYAGIPKHVLHVWQTVYLLITLQPDEYNLYHGGTPEEVLSKYETQRSSWTSQFFTWRTKTIQMDPFNKSCVGIDSPLDHDVVINVIRIDFWRVVFVILGIALFLMAPQLSSNALFYYICGVSLGVTMSFLILVYLVSKLIPKKPAVYGFLVGGWTVGVYLFQLLWQNIRTIAINYQSHVMVYIAFTGLLSFVICYRFGPVTDPRSKNLIKWMLQGVSLAMIFYSSHYQEASVLFMLLLLSYYNFPTSWTYSIMAIWKRRFPPKAKLLTEDEYHEQGVRETVKALDELRSYCSSPECNQWKTVLSLRQPIRFAQFMEGKSHLTDDEFLEYESESRKSMTELTDDSEQDEDY